MDYHQGYDDGMAQGRAAQRFGLGGFLLRVILSITWGGFVYIPLLMIGYWMATRMGHLYSDELLIKIALTFSLAYLALGGIYFVKGILIALRASQKAVWMAIWIACVAITCGIQFFFVQYVLEEFLSNKEVANYKLWSWIGATLVAVLIYGHYKFHTNIAPRSVFPFFVAGFKVTMTQLSCEKACKSPTKSAAYFSNSEMTVSYRKE